jgi:hypothetical protein
MAEEEAAMKAGAGHNLRHPPDTNSLSRERVTVADSVDFAMRHEEDPMYYASIDETHDGLMAMISWLNKKRTS